LTYPADRHSGGGKGGGREGGRPGWHFAGAAFEWRKFGILAFVLQCVSASLYLLLIYSVHRGWQLPVGGAAPRTFAPPGSKNLRAATLDRQTNKGDNEQ